MEIILLILTSALISVLFFCFFCLGYFVRGKRKEDGVVVTKENREFIEEMQKWRNF